MGWRPLVFVCLNKLRHSPHDVQSCVSHQTTGAQHLERQVPEPRVLVIVQPELVPQPLAVQPPTLRVRCVEGEVARRQQVVHVFEVAAEIGNVLGLDGVHALEVVTRFSLVQVQGHHVVFLVLADLGDVDAVDAWPAPIQRSGEVVAYRCIWSALGTSLYTEEHNGARLQWDFVLMILFRKKKSITISKLLMVYCVNGYYNIMAERLKQYSHMQNIKITKFVIITVY